MAAERNSWGLTVDGVRFRWAEYPAARERIAAWRKAGVRVRQFRIDGHPELFIHPDDLRLADKVELETGHG